MQYLIIAYDNDDALQRRLASRQEHLESITKLINEGKVVNAGALIEDDVMVGSSLYVDFENEEELDKWLENEPYVKNNVWNMQEIQIVPIKLFSKS